MRLPRALSIGAVTVAFTVLVGCSTDMLPVGTVDVASCADQPYRAELQVDARDARKVWATHYESGRVVAVPPRPPGRFTFDSARPTVVLDAAGIVVTFTGEITQTGCFDAVSRRLYIGAGDVPDPPN